MKLKNFLITLFVLLTFNSCYFYYSQPPCGQYVIVEKKVYYQGCWYYDYYRYDTGAKYYVVINRGGIYETYIVSNYNTWCSYKCGGYYYIY